MRRVTVLLFCLLATTLMAAKVTQNKCLTKNKFIEALSTAYPINVTIFDEPLKANGTPFTRCASEWNTYGTCCNVVQLEALHGFEQGTTDHNTNLIETTLAQLVDLITSQKAVSDSFKSKLKKAVDVKDYTNSSNKCWSYISTIRGAAMCPTCSGRSEAFFNAAKDKLLIDPATCRKAVDLCEPVFKTLAWVSNNTATITQEFKKVTNATANQSLVLLLNDIKAYSPPAVLSAAFAVYDQHKKDDVKSGVYSGNLCAIFLNVRQPPFIWVNDANSRHRVRRYQTKSKYEAIVAMERKFEDSIEDESLTNDQIATKRAKFFGSANYAKYLAMEADLAASKEKYQKERDEEINKKTLTLKEAGSRGLMELSFAAPSFEVPFPDHDFSHSDCSILMDAPSYAGFSKNDLASCCTVQSSMGQESFHALNMSLSFP